jgi:alginate production protein
MHRQSDIQRTLLSAALALLVSDMAYAATKTIDNGTADSPATSLNNVLSRNHTAFETVDTKPPTDGAKTAVVEPFDANRPPRAHIPIGPNLLFGGYASLRSETIRNYDLSRRWSDANSDVKPGLSLAFAYVPNQYIHAYTNIGIEKSFAVEEIVEEPQDPSVRLNQAYVALTDVVEGSTLQVGRQRFRDARRWLLDENMDAAKLAYRYQDFSIEVSASRFNLVQRELSRRETASNEERFDNYHASIGYKWGRKSRINLFALYQHDRLFDTEHPLFFGLQSEGEIVRRLNYWIQTAIVRGRDGSRRIRGEAVDMGLTKVFDGSIKPAITVGYAYGTGDGNSNDNVDASFRQTGFQSNSDSFNGVVRFKYYGEVLDPRLTNLMIFTGGLGVLPTPKTSFDLVYHYYLQDHASTRIRGSDLAVEPIGLSKHLGSELDLVIGYHEITRLYTRFIIGYFWPGSAFAETSRNGAFTASLLLRYSF